MTQEEPASTARELTRGSRLARNVALNVGGSVLPVVAALVAVPILVRYLGDARFGVMALAWTALGYFTLFDLGIGRAVTHAVADRLGRGREREIGPLIWNSLLTIFPIGMLGGTLLYLLAPWLAGILSLRPDLERETVASFRVLALAVPFATASGALRGALEAHQFFGLVNALRIPLGLLTFIGPLATLPFSRSLLPPMIVLSVGRAALTIAHYVVVARAIPGFREASRGPDGAIARALLRLGGWMQVSHVVSPLMVTLDRFVIGAVLGAGFVTYYFAPQELVTKLWAFNIAVLPVFFSAVSATSSRDAERSAVLFDKLLRVTLALLFLPALMLVCLAPDILRLWLGPAFALQSRLVMQLLTIAVFVNCFAQGAMALIQGLGRPDLTAKCHLVELPFYALLLWLLLPRYGIVGAAIAWSVRTIADTVILLATCRVLLPSARPVVMRMSGWLLATSGLLALGAILAGEVASPLRFALVALAIPAWLYACWSALITPAERSLPMKSLIAAWRPERA
jgi:O-antigen/teichoic acid export membrane protein